MLLFLLCRDMIPNISGGNETFSVYDMPAFVFVTPKRQKTFFSLSRSTFVGNGFFLIESEKKDEGKKDKRPQKEEKEEVRGLGKREKEGTNEERKKGGRRKRKKKNRKTTIW